jgi:hypothetical protein
MTVAQQNIIAKLAFGDQGVPSRLKLLMERVCQRTFDTNDPVRLPRHCCQIGINDGDLRTYRTDAPDPTDAPQTLFYPLTRCNALGKPSLRDWEMGERWYPQDALLARLP